MSLRVTYTCFVLHLAPIYLLNSNPKITGFIGETVTMQVSVFGLGQHTYQWMRMGHNSHIKSDATGVNGIRLTLPNVSFDDDGDYLFTASTQWSTNMTKVDLRVTCELCMNNSSGQRILLGIYMYVASSIVLKAV